MAADESEAPVLSEDEVREGCVPRGRFIVARGWPGWLAIGAPGLAASSGAGQAVRGRWREARTRPLREQIPRLLASLLGACGLPGGPSGGPGCGLVALAHPLREGDGLGGAASRDSASRSCRRGRADRT